MSWKTINDPDILARLVQLPVVGLRMVCLDPGRDVRDLPIGSNDVEAWRAAPFAKRYELKVLDCDPAAVLVVDGTDNRYVGGYVWTAGGGRIPSSRDSRVVQLADALDAEYRGEAPPSAWSNPESTCGDCGESFNPAAGGPASQVDHDLGDGVRLAAEQMTQQQMFTAMCQHCTDAQLRSVERYCGRRDYRVVMLSNIRVAGGGAIGSVCPIIEDPRTGDDWMILPSGVLSRMEQ